MAYRPGKRLDTKVEKVQVVRRGVGFRGPARPQPNEILIVERCQVSVAPHPLDAKFAARDSAVPARVDHCPDGAAVFEDRRRGVPRNYAVEATRRIGPDGGDHPLDSDVTDSDRQPIEPVRKHSRRLTIPFGLHLARHVGFQVGHYLIGILGQTIQLAIGGLGEVQLEEVFKQPHELVVEAGGVQ